MAMRLRIRTLKNETFQINVSSADTVEQVKALIEREKNHPVGHQKLIYNGVILVDSKTVAEYDIKENGFVVLMVKAPVGAAPPAAAAGPALPAVSSAPATPPAKSAAPVKSVPPPNQPAADDGGVQPMDTREDVATAESTLLTNAGQIEATVTQLCEMGFARDDVVKALRAAFNNPNRAVEYLMSGNIPDVGPPAPAANRPPAPAGAGAGGAPLNLFEAADRARQPGGGGGGAAGGGAGGENIFDFLRHNPEFNALRFMVQQNPALLQPILAQLGQANPDLLQLITAHQAEFTELLNEPVNEADLPQQLARGGGGGGGGGGRGVVQIQLTAEEKGAVDRLMGLGFGQQAALEAYLSCDKNEEVAANYLLENGMDMGGDGEEEEGGFEEEEGFDDEGFDEGGH